LAGDHEAGMRGLQQAVAIAGELVKVDPHNSTFQEEFARYATQLARLYRLDGATAAATALTTQSLAILDRLTRQDPTDTGLQRELAEARTEHAAESRLGDQTDAARAQAQNALNILKPLLVAQPHDRSVLLATASAQLLLAELSTDARAAASLREGVVTAAQAQQSGREDPRLLALQVQALLALERKAEAQPLIRQLWSSGYRDGQLLAVLRRRHIAYPVNPQFQKQLLAGSRQ
jgi:hypothetical protein